jgi:two-component system chemotaxis response regulator CheY
MRILIVDDSRAMRMIIRRAMRQAGYGSHDVVEAENGQEALGEIARNPPDLVLADWNMPVMNGLELLQRLTSSGSPIPLGFVTSECTPQMRRRARDAGASFFIAKPFTADVLQAALAPFFR